MSGAQRQRGILLGADAAVGVYADWGQAWYISGVGIPLKSLKQEKYMLICEF